MPIELGVTVLLVLVLGFLIWQGGPDLLWRIAGVLAVYIGAQVAWYGSNHDWSPTHHGLFVFGMTMPYLIGGVCLLVSLRRSFRRKNPPAPERPSVQR